MTPWRTVCGPPYGQANGERLIIGTDRRVQQRHAPATNVSSTSSNSPPHRISGCSRTTAAVGCPALPTGAGALVGQPSDLRVVVVLEFDPQESDHDCAAGQRLLDQQLVEEHRAKVARPYLVICMGRTAFLCSRMRRTKSALYVGSHGVCLEADYFVSAFQAAAFAEMSAAAGALGVTSPDGWSAACLMRAILRQAAPSLRAPVRWRRGRRQGSGSAQGSGAATPAMTAFLVVMRCCRCRLPVRKACGRRRSPRVPGRRPG